MNYSIVYSSPTGNTEKLASAIAEALPQERCLYFGKPEGYIDAPLVFVGFWTDKGTCDSTALEFLKTLKDKKVFLFGTAGFGGSAEYYEKILRTAQGDMDSSNTVIGTYMCQGKMPMSIRQRYEKMLTATAADLKIQEQIENFDRAASHPDQTDCEQLKRQVQQLAIAD